jgi:hypothetical protein
MTVLAVKRQMGKKGSSWFSSVKKVFKPSSKDSPVPENKVIHSSITFSVFITRMLRYLFSFLFSKTGLLN